MSLLKDALTAGLEHATQALITHDRDLGRTTLKNQNEAERITREIETIKQAQALLEKEHALTFKRYEYSCGDGCCYEQGYHAHLGEEHIGSYPDAEYAISDVFEHFGIDLRTEYEY